MNPDRVKATVSTLSLIPPTKISNLSTPNTTSGPQTSNYFIIRLEIYKSLIFRKVYSIFHVMQFELRLVVFYGWLR